MWVAGFLHCLLFGVALFGIIVHYGERSSGPTYINTAGEDTCRGFPHCFTWLLVTDGHGNDAAKTLEIDSERRERATPSCSRRMQ